MRAGESQAGNPIGSELVLTCLVHVHAIPCRQKAHTLLGLQCTYPRLHHAYIALLFALLSDAFIPIRHYIFWRLLVHFQLIWALLLHPLCSRC